MSTGSPTTFLLWSILSCIFLALLVVHLWLYDRFACLKWDAGRQPGAFKRIMTYSYLGTLPTLICFNIAMTALKFEEGWISLPGVLPRPFENWQPSHSRWLLPLFFLLSISWSLELVTHLEELTFWLFLLHQGPGKRNWFHSWEFRTWYLGSLAAILGMPLTVLVARRNLTTALGWIFFVGSLAGTTTNICFLYVIFRFPKFLEHVKAEGADPDVFVKLVTFYQLNCIRVVFRFVFSLPLLMIGIDAIHGPFPILGNPFALDFLLMMAGIGSFISSGITLLVFFPRSITHESGYQIKIVSPQSSGTTPALAMDGPEFYYNHHQHYTRNSSNPISALDNLASPASTTRMRSFQFPNIRSPSQHQHQVTPTPQHPSFAESGNLSLQTEYDSDGESVAMTPQAALRPMQHSQSHPGHTRADSFSKSGTGTMGRSDDTMWDEGEQIESLGHDMHPHTTFRRHSAGPFVYHRHGKTVRMHPILPTQSQAPSERPESHLHPYAS